MFETRSNAGRQFRKQIVTLNHAASIGNGRGIGKSRAGGKSGFLSFGYIGHGQRDLRRGASSDSHAATLNRGKMFSYRINFIDGGAAGDQRAIQRLEVFECDGWVERKFNERGSSA